MAELVDTGRKIASKCVKPYHDQPFLHKKSNLDVAQRLLLRIAGALGPSPLVDGLQRQEEGLVRELASALVDEGFLPPNGTHETLTVEHFESHAHSQLKIDPFSNSLIGESDCLVLGSVGPVEQSLNAVPKLPSESKDDTIQHELEKVADLIQKDPLLHLPPLGPHRVEGEGEVVPVWLDGCGVRHSKKFYMKLIEDFLTGCRTPAATIWYSGHGQKNTGNWCFQDSTISLEDLLQLYENCFKGRLLTIVTDCSYSGHWAYQLASRLDTMKLPPCGHKAIEEGFLIKVHASCHPCGRPLMNCYVRDGVMVNADGLMRHAPCPSRMHTPPQHHQTPCTVDSTQFRCCSLHDQPCTFRLNALHWSDVPNAASLKECVRLVEYGNAWQYVLVNEERVRSFDAAMSKEGRVEKYEDYGRLLCSGWGEDPPQADIEAFFTS